jgi:hypothetical protein
VLRAIKPKVLINNLWFSLGLTSWDLSFICIIIIIIYIIIIMSDWDKIKNDIAELNGNNKLSPLDNKPLDNELIMCLFCNKVNLKYRFEPYYEVPFIEYTTRIFDSILGYDYLDDKEQQNFFEVAKKDPQIITYINSIKNVILTQIRIISKKNPDIIKDQNIDSNKEDIYDSILNKFDINLILVSALENLNMRKYKILSKMLYNSGKQDTNYLDYAKESIINSNKNISLDKIVYGIDLSNKYNNIEHFNNNSNNLYLNFFLILIMILIMIMITVNYLHT